MHIKSRVIYEYLDIFGNRYSYIRSSALPGSVNGLSPCFFTLSSDIMVYIKE